MSRNDLIYVYLSNFSIPNTGGQKDLYLVLDQKHRTSTEKQFNYTKLSTAHRS